MDNRLIFLYFGIFVISQGKLGLEEISVVMMRRLNNKAEWIGKSVHLLLSYDEKFSFESNLFFFSLQEKSRDEKILKSYQEPKQVGRSSRPRRARERGLRN